MHHDTTRVSLLSQRMSGHIVLAVRGECGIATTAGLRDQIAVIVEEATAPVIIDLSGVSFCDASGLAMLVGAQRRARSRGLTVAIAGPRQNVRKMLRISGLDDAFTVYPTVSAARLGRGRPSRMAGA